jgi:hypothetical protein
MARWRYAEALVSLTGQLKAEEKFQKLQGEKSMKELIAALGQFVGSKQVDSLERAA